MRRPPSTQNSIEDTPYYHYIGRVVRRTFLYGNNNYPDTGGTGKNYDHRRGWAESPILKLTEVLGEIVGGVPLLLFITSQRGYCHRHPELV